MIAAAASLLVQRDRLADRGPASAADHSGLFDVPAGRKSSEPRDQFGLALAVGCCLYLERACLTGNSVSAGHGALCRQRQPGGATGPWRRPWSADLWGSISTGFWSGCSRLLFGGNWIVDPEVLAALGGGGDAPGVRLDNGPDLPVGRLRSLSTTNGDGMSSEAAADVTPRARGPGQRAARALVFLRRADLPGHLDAGRPA